EYSRQQILIRGPELVTDVGRHARLNPAGTQGDESRTNEQPEPRVVDRQRQVTEAIDNRKRQNRAVFAEKSVGYERPKNREEVDGACEVVKGVPGVQFGHRGRNSVSR